MKASLSARIFNEMRHVEDWAFLLISFPLGRRRDGDMPKKFAQLDPFKESCALTHSSPKVESDDGEKYWALK